MVVLGLQATRIVAKAVLMCIAGKALADGLEWTVNHVECLKVARPIFKK